MSKENISLLIPLFSTLGGALIAGFFAFLKTKSDNNVTTTSKVLDAQNLLIAKQTEQLSEMAVQIGRLTQKVEELEGLLRKNNIKY
jgi:septal ring factor EnvC (AmiA/AmiB activator)